MNLLMDRKPQAIKSTDYNPAGAVTTNETLAPTKDYTSISYFFNTLGLSLFTKYL